MHPSSFVEHLQQTVAVFADARLEVTSLFLSSSTATATATASEVTAAAAGFGAYDATDFVLQQLLFHC